MIDACRRTHGFSTEKTKLSTGYPKHVQTCPWHGAVSTEQVRRTSRFACQVSLANVPRGCQSARVGQLAGASPGMNRDAFNCSVLAPNLRLGVRRDLTPTGRVCSRPATLAAR